MRFDTPLKITLQAHEIPDDSVVTKVTGEKKYTLKRSIKIYTSGADGHKEIKPAPGTIFLVSNASINQYKDDFVLSWQTTLGNLVRLAKHDEYYRDGDEDAI